MMPLWLYLQVVTDDRVIALTDNDKQVAVSDIKTFSQLICQLIQPVGPAKILKLNTV